MSNTGQLRWLQLQIDALAGEIVASDAEFGEAPVADLANNVEPVTLFKVGSSHADTSAIVIKRDDDTWGDSSPYGGGQAIVLLSPSTQDASDETGDGVSGSNENPVLFRVDAYGGIGTTQGIHVAPGLRDNHGGPTPAQGIWVQQFELDAAGIILSGPNPASVPSPSLPFLYAETWAGVGLADISPAGAFRTFADDGVTAVASISPKSTSPTGYRAIFLAQNAATAGVAIRLAASQTAVALSVLDSSATMLSGIDPTGTIVTRDDSGTTSAAAIYGKSTASNGYRAIFTTVTAATAGVAIKAAASQTAVLLAALDSSATMLSGIDPTGTIVTRDNSGTTSAAAIYAKSTASNGYRAIFNTVTAATGGLALKAAASQTAALLANLDSSATMLSGADSIGNLFTKDGGGSTNVAVLYTGTTPASGYRAIFVTGSTGTSGLGIRLASGQTAPALVVVDGGGTPHTIVDNTGAIVGAGLTSFQGRGTAAAVLTFADVNGVTAGNALSAGSLSVGSINSTSTSFFAAISASSITTSAGANLGSSSVFMPNLTNIAGSQVVEWSTGGQLTRVTSSRRYKKAIRDYQPNPNILDVRLRSFLYKANKNTDHRSIGVIAEEAIDLIPEITLVDEQDRPDSVRDAKVGWMLIPFVREHRDRLGDHDGRIAAIEAEIKELKGSR